MPAARCKRMYGSNSNHTDRQYWAVDSITASSTPCSRNQIKSRCNSLGMVTNRRRSGFSSGVLASRPPPSALSCARQCLLSCTASLPPGVEAAERARKRLHTVTCYHPSCQDGWRDTDWFKTHVPDQTPTRPHFIQSAKRPLPSTLDDRTRRLDPIFISMGGPQAHGNSKPPQWVNECNGDVSPTTLLRYRQLHGFH